MLVMVIAGHDTTGYAIAWILIEVAGHPKVYEKIKDEMRRIIPLGSKSVEITTIGSLEYLDCVIKEGLRLRPSSATGSARLITEDIHYNGFDIPKGTMAGLPFLPTQRVGVMVGLFFILLLCW